MMPASAYDEGDMTTLDDTKTRIIHATIKAVRQYGLEGVRTPKSAKQPGSQSKAYGDIAADFIAREYICQLRCQNGYLRYGR